jgi:hypothetical protein
MQRWSLTMTGSSEFKLFHRHRMSYEQGTISIWPSLYICWVTHCASTWRLTLTPLCVSHSSSTIAIEIKSDHVPSSSSKLYFLIRHFCTNPLPKEKKERGKNFLFNQPIVCSGIPEPPPFAAATTEKNSHSFVQRERSIVVREHF